MPRKQLSRKFLCDCLPVYGIIVYGDALRGGGGVPGSVIAGIKRFLQDKNQSPRPAEPAGKTRNPFHFRRPTTHVMDTDIIAASFSNPRIMRSTLVLALGVGIALCVLIVLFRGTWYLPALVVAVAIGSVAAFLYWLDSQDFSREEGFLRAGGDEGKIEGENVPGIAILPKPEGSRGNTPQSFTILPGAEPLVVGTDTLYATFTNPKVVTSMLLVGLGLGLALSVLIGLYRGQWFMPVAFAAIALATVFLYMVWLDRQDLRED